LKVVRSALALLRIRQWVKNGFVLAPLFFGAEIGPTSLVWRGVCAVVVFCQRGLYL
jgi:4-hydroxybenzoate polyprenyltransferase